MSANKQPANGEGAEQPAVKRVKYVVLFLDLPCECGVTILTPRQARLL